MLNKQIYSCSIFLFLGFAACHSGNDTEITKAPDSSRYTRTVLAEGLDEPLEMAILPGNDVLFVERKGGVKLYKSSTKETRLIANINVFSGIEDGLLGVAPDPEYQKNHWIYFYYAVPGEKAVNRLSRFELKAESLPAETEEILLEIPTQRKYCCHSAGYLAFDKQGDLYLSTGDNTNAEETEGYTPVDERPGRQLADDQGTAANTNDLRGKILRIKPLAQGGYSIPDGNLFPKGTPRTRPEIYAMGMRNPYRFSIDRETGYLYFGEVGPDTKVRAPNGELMSYDEINQVRKPGYFGWPYFLGNNQVFPKYNYATRKPEAGKDPAKPINESPNNTGLRELPPAQPAMIWYGKGNSTNFPLVGNGGATAMAGPVYYSKLFKKAPYKLSDYYNGKLFIYEWIRGWIMAVTFDEQGNYNSMEPFLAHMKFDAPVDMQFAPDGAVYILEYGTNWFSKNNDARLIRIEYAEGNRNPVPAIHMDQQYGAAPFTVQFSATGTMDHDESDKLTYRWKIGEKTYQGDHATHTFSSNGAHEVALTVTDNQGGSGTTTARVFVGNTPPAVKLHTRSNRSFYWDGSVLDYQAVISDKEERTDPGRVSISFGYIPHGQDAAIVLTSGQDAADFQYLKGQALLSGLDCKSCHSPDQESVGPTYRAIASRYAGKPGSAEQLAKKIIDGGSGNWGERAMSPHPELPEADATEIVRYIYSLSVEKQQLPLNGNLPLTDHKGQGEEGVYLLNASYRDGGANGIAALTGRDYISLRHPVVQAEDFDEGNVSIATITTAFMSYIYGIKRDHYIRFDQIDLRGIKRIGFRIQPNGAGGVAEVRQGRKDGPVICRVSIPAGKNSGPDSGWKELVVPINENKDMDDLYIVFLNEAAAAQHLFHIDWFKFYNQ